MAICLIAHTITTPFSLYNSLSSPQISSAVAPPPRKSKTSRRNLRLRRTRRRSDSDEFSGGFSGGGYDGGFFSGGGGGWSSGGGGWGEWEWESSPYDDDPAFDFVYGIMCWAALSNCLHFAVKKMARIGGGSEREKIRLVTIC